MLPTAATVPALTRQNRPPAPPSPRPRSFGRAEQGFASYGSRFMIHLGLFADETDASSVFGGVAASAGLFGACARAAPWRQ